jgi:hypothetical protein
MTPRAAMVMVLTSTSIALTRGAVEAQGPCREADVRSAELIADLGDYTQAKSPGYAAVRDSLHLRPVAAAALRLVTDPQVCASAVRAYRATLDTSAARFTGKVYVVAAGDRYVVLDPDYRLDPRVVTWYVAVFDTTWQWLSAY